MRRFVLVAVVFVLVQAAVLAALLLVHGPREDYLSAAADKHDLLHDTPSPRLIFVGGSNLAFGLDCSRVDRAFDGYHPVNMGLSDGLGLETMLREIESGVRPGDVVVVSPEYEMLWTSTVIQAVRWDALFSLPETWRFLGPDDRLELIAAAADEPRVLTHRAATAAYYKLYRAVFSHYPKPLVYCCSGFDGYGDFTAARALPSDYAGFDKAWTVDERHLHAQIAALNRFTRDCARRQVPVFVAFPPIPQDFYAANRETVDDTAALLESDLEATVLGAPAATVFTASDFWDDQHHLCGAAVGRRTDVLIAQLEKVLPARP